MSPAPSAIIRKFTVPARVLRKGHHAAGQGGPPGRCHRMIADGAGDIQGRGAGARSGIEVTLVHIDGHEDLEHSLVEPEGFITRYADAGADGFHRRSATRQLGKSGGGSYGE